MLFTQYDIKTSHHSSKRNTGHFGVNIKNKNSLNLQVAYAHQQRTNKQNNKTNSTVLLRLTINSEKKKHYFGQPRGYADIH